MDPKDIKLSKQLSWVLRHGASKVGLKFDDGAFIDVENILNLKQFRSFSISDIQRVVETNDKKRFTLRIKNSSENALQIRANQGHSLEVNEDGLLTLLTENQVPQYVYHGTYFRCLESIKTKGLSRMQRNHVHFTSKYPGQPGVVSGMRNNCEIFIVVDAAKAAAAGFKFYESDNKVILCPGNEHGMLPPTYIKEIWRLKPLQKIN